MAHGKLLGMILLMAAWGQATPHPNPAEATHYPQVTHAELPLYPALAWTLHLTGSVEIQVVVEKGAVANAEVKSVVLGPTKDPLNEEGKKKVALLLSNPSLENIKTWRFQQEDRATFPVTYVYKIEGEATALPENPKVELDLPRLVEVTAKPFKPQCSDCGANVTGTPIR